MPLFRPHRGTLEDSLKRTVIVNNIHDLCQEVQKEVESWVDTPITPESISIENYCFDKRIGWHTQIVTTNVLHANQNFGVIGFLSEPFTPGASFYVAKMDGIFDPNKFKLFPEVIIPIKEEENKKMAQFVKCWDCSIVLCDDPTKAAPPVWTRILALKIQNTVSVSINYYGGVPLCESCWSNRRNLKEK